MGMPLDAWILLVTAVGLGLGLEVAFQLARRRDRRTAGSSTSPAGGAPPGRGGDEAHP